MGMIWAFSLGAEGSLYDEDFIDAACHFAGANGAILYQIETLSTSLLLEKWTKPYKHFLEPWTRILDLTKAEDTLLSDMHEKWRYNIRLAQKRWVEVRWVSSTGENIDIWMNLLSDTSSRDGFSKNSKKYYECFLSAVGKDESGGLLFAYFESQVIAGGIFVYSWDTAIYYYGASSSDREVRKHMAPYLLQWEAIREAKRRWCERYDFLGIAWPDNKNSSLRGVTEFKEKFGGEIVKLGPKYLFPLSWKYTLFCNIRRLKKLF